MASRGLIAFIGGAANKGSEILDRQEQQRRDEEKAKLLAQLQLDTSKILAEFQEKIASRRGDAKMSGTDGTDFITRNANGEELGRRALTSTELEDRETSRQKASLDMESTRGEIDYRRGMLRETERSNRAQEGLAAARIAAARDSASSSSSSSSTDGMSTSNLITNQLLEQFQAEVEDASKKGIPLSYIRSVAQNVADAALSRADVNGTLNADDIRNNFLKSLNAAYSGKSEERGGWSLDTLSSRYKK